jgi:hypothetical protein
VLESENDEAKHSQRKRLGELTADDYRPPTLTNSERAKESLVKRFKAFHDSLTSTDKKVINDKFQLENIFKDPILKLIAVEKPEAILNLKLRSCKDPEAGYISMDGNIDVYVKHFTHKVLTEIKDQVVQVKRRNLVSFKINRTDTRAFGSIFSDKEQEQIREKLKWVDVVQLASSKAAADTERKIEQANKRKGERNIEPEF